MTSIEGDAEIKIFDNENSEIPFQYLKRVITKYEKSNRFSLRIEIMNGDEDWLDMHAVDLMKVCI